MSANIENIIGIDSVLINRLNSGNSNYLLQNNSLFKRGLNPLYIKLASVLLICICILGFYTYYSFLNIIYNFEISLLISSFLTFFMFNIYRLLFCGTFGPAQTDHEQTKSNLLTVIFKYFFLITIGLLFSYVSYAVFFQKGNIEHYVVNNPEIKIDIITVFILINKLGGIKTIIGFILFLFLFLLPQLIIEIKIDKQRLKQISKELNQIHLDKIFNNNPGLKKASQLKDEWKERHLFQLSNDAISGKTTLKKKVSGILNNDLLNKQL